MFDIEIPAPNLCWEGWLQSIKKERKSNSNEKQAFDWDLEFSVCAR